MSDQVLLNLLVLDELLLVLLPGAIDVLPLFALLLELATPHLLLLALNVLPAAQLFFVESAQIAK